MPEGPLFPGLCCSQRLKLAILVSSIRSDNGMSDSFWSSRLFPDPGLCSQVARPQTVGVVCSLAPGSTGGSSTPVELPFSAGLKAAWQQAGNSVAYKLMDTAGSSLKANSWPQQVNTIRMHASTSGSGGDSGGAGMGGGGGGGGGDDGRPDGPGEENNEGQEKILSLKEVGGCWYLAVAYITQSDLLDLFRSTMVCTHAAG